MLKVSILRMERVSLQVTGIGWVQRGRDILAALFLVSLLTPDPVLMPTVNTQKDFSKDAATLIALGSLLGRSHCSDIDSKATVSGGSEDQLSCQWQSLPGYSIPERLHCHQQSFSSCILNKQQNNRNALCSFSFVPFAYLLLKNAHEHLRHESNFKSCFIYLIPVTLILIMLPISNANSRLYKRGAQRNQSCPYTREDIVDLSAHVI